MLQSILQLAALQSFLLALFCLLSRPKRTTRYLLAAFAFIVAILCFFQAMEGIEFYLRFPHLMRADWGLLLLLWPLVFLFIRVSLSQQSWNTSDLFHFAPYLVNICFMMPFYVQPAESKIQILNYYTPFITQGFYGYAIYFKVLSLAVGIQSLFYSKRVMNELKSHADRVKELFSKSDGIEIRWFFVIVYGMVTLSLLYIVSLFLNFQSSYLDFDYHQLFYIGLFVLILVLSYRSFHQPFDTSTVETDKATHLKNVAHKSSSLSDEILQQLATGLRVLFEKENIYLNSNLNAAEVAERLNTNRQNLSQVLSRHFNTNFYDFVNNYRVREFQARLNSGNFSHLTFLGLALESGFSSKSSFNSVFKNATGMTPSAYAASVKKKID